jgi:enoyl-CoA hydratase
MALCESMSKPVIAAISGTCLAGGFEFALSCDLRIADDGDYLIGLPEANLGLLPGAGGTQRLSRTIGTPAALMHILMGVPLTPREAERKGLVHETGSGKALDRAMAIARRLLQHTPESVAYIKRLVRKIGGSGGARTHLCGSTVQLTMNAWRQAEYIKFG